MENIAKFVGARLRQSREDHGFTQEYVMKLMGYTSLSTISNHESGKRMPRPEELYKIANIYDVSMDWLYGRSPSKELNYIPHSEEDIETLNKLKNASEKDKAMVNYVLEPQVLKQTTRK